MILQITNLFLILGIGSASYYFVKKVLLNKIKKDAHQRFSSDNLGVPIGGFVIFSFIFIFNFYESSSELVILFLIFFLGLMSDIKIFNSPKYRFISQAILIFIFIYFSDYKIASTKILFFDIYLNNYYINIFFTTYCLLILLNGSNFIDGLNSLTLSYFLLVLIFILLISHDINLIYDYYIIVNLVFIISVCIILNFFNIIFLGDNGAYLIGLFIGLFLIKIHQLNSNISPYFIILLLWYPCFENLFSIVRKKLFKFSIINPDNSHLHHLLFLYLREKFKKRDKIISNNITSISIVTYNFAIFLLGYKYYYNTKFMVLLIIVNILVYIFIYLKLLKFFENKKSINSD